MAKAPAAPANGTTLQWAREEAGLTVEEAARRISVKPERLASWETGDGKPTINQLRNVARLYQRTPAFFFVQGPPPPTPSDKPPDFRGRDTSGLSADLAREIGRARERRKAFLRLHGEPTGRLPVLRGLVDRPAEAGEEFRSLVGISAAAQLSMADAMQALQAWTLAVEGFGVLVFQMSRVDPVECRGLSLYEDVQPIIILNGADDPEARIFTLFHEMAHLLNRSGGVCHVWTGTAIERICNAFAGAFLLPGDALRDELSTDNPVAALSRLAARFKVSQSAVAIRLRDLNVLSQQQLDDQLDLAVRLAAQKRESQRSRPSTGGPPYHLLKLRNLGATYVTTVLDALRADEITAVDAAYFLESKVSTIDRMEAELVRRSGTA